MVTTMMRERSPWRAGALVALGLTFVGCVGYAYRKRVKEVVVDELSDVGSRSLGDTKMQAQARRGMRSRRSTRCSRTRARSSAPPPSSPPSRSDRRREMARRRARRRAQEPHPVLDEALALTNWVLDRPEARERAGRRAPRRAALRALPAGRRRLWRAVGRARRGARRGGRRAQRRGAQGARGRAGARHRADLRQVAPRAAPPAGEDVGAHLGRDQGRLHRAAARRARRRPPPAASRRKPRRVAAAPVEERASLAVEAGEQVAALAAAAAAPTSSRRSRRRRRRRRSRPPERAAAAEGRGGGARGRRRRAAPQPAPTAGATESTQDELPATHSDKRCSRLPPRALGSAAEAARPAAPGQFATGAPRRARRGGDGISVARSRSEPLGSRGCGVRPALALICRAGGDVPCGALRRHRHDPGFAEFVPARAGLAALPRADADDARACSAADAGRSRSRDAAALL